MKAVQLPSGNWRVRVESEPDENGNRHWKSFTALTENEVLAEAYKWKATHSNQEYSRSFANAMRKYNDHRMDYISPTTDRENRSKTKVLNACFPSFVKKNVQAISAKDIQAVIDVMNRNAPPRHKLQHKPRKLAPKTIKNYVEYIRSVLKTEKNFIPIEDLQLPGKRPSNIRVPDDWEIKMLRESLAGTELEIPFLLAAFGPLRRGEISALKYPDDFKKNVVHVHADMVQDSRKKWTLKEMPKNTSSDRFVTLPDHVLDAIKKAGKVTELNPNQITDAFDKALSNTKMKHFRFHDLRHWCASTLHAQGVPDAYIMQRGGWATDSTLKKVYRHTLQDQSKTITQKAIDHFNSFF